MAQTLARLQPWIEHVPRPQRRLGIFICLALAAHLAVFFFIRIDSTRAEWQHQPRTHVTMEDMHPEAETSDAFWDSLTDPRLFLLPTHPPASLFSDEPALDFSAIQFNLSTPAFPPPAQPANPVTSLAMPTAAQAVTADMNPARQPFFYDETPPVLATKTMWHWSKTLADRQPANVPPLPSPVSVTELSPSDLMVGVGPNGTVEHVLLENSCQKPELDQQAILAARKIQFRPSDRPGIVWGRITIFWHYTPAPPDVVVPTPPSPSGG